MNTPILTEPTAFRHETANPRPRQTFPREKGVDLAGARVLVLGCGSVGGVAAWALASAGVTTLELADRDVLEQDNLRRHVCGAADLGRPKAEAVAGFVRDRFSTLTPATHAFCFLEAPDRLRGLIERSEVVLAAVDAEAPKHLIDVQARALGRPAIYVGVYGGGWATEAILSDADTPCYACSARALGRAGVPFEPPAGLTAYALPDPQAAPSEWSRADLTSILPCAALAARLVTARLGRQRGSERAWQEFRGAGANAWRLALRDVPAWGFGPWVLRPLPVARQPDCPGCGGEPASLEEFERLLAGGAV